MDTRRTIWQPSRKLRAAGVLLLFACAPILALSGGASALAQCYGGPCGNSAHKPAQVTWYDDLLSRSGWGEGPPCSSCHTTTQMVKRSAHEVEAKKNSPQTMPPRRFQQFHQQAVRVTRGRGAIQTLPEAQVKPQDKDAYRWVLEAQTKPAARPRRR